MSLKFFITSILPYGLIFLWLIFSIYYIYKFSGNLKKDKKSKFYFNIHWLDSIPSVFTTLGIFGTFLGVFYGLFYFNVKDLNSSIPKLLEGLTTAFGTSVLGIILSLIFSGIIEQYRKTLDDKQEEKESKIFEAESQFRKDIIEAVTESLNQNFKTVIQNLENNFKGFVENANNTNNTLVKSLTEKFDKFLNENFGRLRQSIDNLIEVQNKNQSHLNYVLQSFNQIVNSLSNTSSIISNIATNIHSLTDDNSILQKILKELEHIIVEESTFSKSIVDLKNVSLIITNLANQTEKNNLLMEKSLEREDNLIVQTKVLLQKYASIQVSLNDFINRLSTIPSDLQKTASHTKEISDSVAILSNSNSILRKLVGEEVENRREIIVEYGNIINNTAGQLQNWYKQEQKFSKMMHKLINDLQRNEWIKREYTFTNAVENLIQKIENTESYKLKISESWEDVTIQFSEFIEGLIELNNIVEDNINNIKPLLKNDRENVIENEQQIIENENIIIENE